MKKLVVVWSVLLIFAGAALASGGPDLAPGCQEPLALPADKILRISQDLVEFEHHGFLPISPEVECYQHWEEEILPIPLDAVKVGFEQVVATRCV